MRDLGAVGLTIRTAGAADAEAIAVLWSAADAARRAGHGTAADARDRTRRRLTTPGTVAVVAEDGGELVAAAMAEQARTGGAPDADPVPGLAHVTQVVVRPDRWGEGIGGLVVGRLVEEARRHGYHRGQLWTQAENTRARRLYARLGWAASGRSTVDDRGETIVHYQLEL